MPARNALDFLAPGCGHGVLRQSGGDARDHVDYMDPVGPTIASNGKRLVLLFHGVGHVPAHVGAEERPFWCTESTFNALLDEVRPASQRAGIPIQLTFDDGNDTDALGA